MARRANSVGFCAVLLSLWSCSPAPRATQPSVLTLGTAVAGSGLLSFGQALAPLVQRDLPHVHLEVLETDGALDNVRGISNGDLDLAFVHADVAFEGVEGQGPLDLRALAVLQITPMHLVASPTSGVNGVGDLRRKRVAIGRDGTGTLVLAQSLLDAYGVGHDIERMSVPLAEAFQMLRDGKLDAVFNLAAYSTGLAEVLSAGGHLVPIEGAPLEELRRARPFLQPMVVPAGTYPNVPATRTIGVQTLLVCRASLDSLVARDVTRAFLKAVTQLPEAYRWNPVPPGEAAATSLPLHPGAIRYYREEELLR